MSQNQKSAFFEQYAQLAMEEQVKYGIPASITLAQMYLESGGGTSSLAQEGKNFFGIKCSRDWLDAGKPYTLHSDDRKDEKFCSYASAEESMRHHSALLMGDRYSRCREYGSMDYKKWAYGLKAAGYATDSRYAQKLITFIEDNGLDQYDRHAATMSKREDKKGNEIVAGHYCLPLAGTSLVMTDGYNKAPTAYRNHVHGGTDFKANYQNVYSTEDNGKVVSTGKDKSSGKHVTVEYLREGGTYRVTYCHLDNIGVKKGDSVDAGTVLGVSGNTGNSTGPHLHMSVSRLEEGKEEKKIDPLDYLAEISVRGNLSAKVVAKGSGADLLADRKGAVDTRPTPSEVLFAASQGKTLNKEQRENISKASDGDLMSLLASQNGIGGGEDLFGGIVKGLFMSALSMAAILDNPAMRSSGGKQEVQADAAVEEVPTVIHRQREGVNVDKARDMALMNFSAEYPESQQQSTGQRMA